MTLSFKNYPNLNDHLDYLGFYDEHPDFPQEGDLVTPAQIYFFHDFVFKELAKSPIVTDDDVEIIKLIMDDTNSLLLAHASYSLK